jgi:hypothetical protein
MKRFTRFKKWHVAQIRFNHGVARSLITELHRVIYKVGLPFRYKERFLNKSIFLFLQLIGSQKFTSFFIFHFSLYIPKNNHRFLKNYCYVVLLLALTACNPTCDDCAVKTSGQEFFPLVVGQFTEFDVSEQQYALGVAPVGRSYQVKESVVEQYNDVAGQAVFRIVRYKRANSNQKWQPDSTLTARLRTDEVVKNESGKDYVKIVFPVADRSTWNGNVYNNLGEDKYEIKNTNKPYTVGGQSFERTVTVIQQSDSTLVGQDKRIEIYAADIGLVYKESANLQFCSSTPACVGKAQIDYGLKRIIRFVKTGKE